LQLKKTAAKDVYDAEYFERFFVAMQPLLEQHPSLHEDVLEFRFLLESSAAELAAQRATDDDLQRLAQAYARLDLAYAGSNRSEQVAALRSFSAAAWKGKVRDRWIGWDFRHQYARLGLLAKMAAF
jgi:DNA-binding FadR family transcriptional regulator